MITNDIRAAPVAQPLLVWERASAEPNRALLALHVPVACRMARAHRQCTCTCTVSKVWHTLTVPPSGVCRYTCTSVEHPESALRYRQVDVQPDLYICGDTKCQSGGRPVSCFAALKKLIGGDTSQILEVPQGGPLAPESAAHQNLSDGDLLMELLKETPPIHLPASHPLFVSYTSGSTGKPKGVVHVHGGYMYGVSLSMETTFNIDTTKESTEVILTIGTTGWITGQSYMIAGQ